MNLSQFCCSLLLLASFALPAMGQVPVPDETPSEPRDLPLGSNRALAAPPAESVPRPTAAVTLDAISASQGLCAGNGSECELGELAVGAKASVAIRVRTTNEGKMDFQGQVDSDLYDPDLTDNFVIKRMGGSLGLILPVLLGLLWRRSRNNLL